MRDATLVTGIAGLTERQESEGPGSTTGMKNQLCDPGEAVSRADKVWLILRRLCYSPWTFVGGLTCS